jgi:hypothetical protein
MLRIPFALRWNTLSISSRLSPFVSGRTMYSHSDPRNEIVPYIQNDPYAPRALGELMDKNVELMSRFPIQFVAVLKLIARERNLSGYISELIVQGKPPIPIPNASK